MQSRVGDDATRLATETLPEGVRWFDIKRQALMEMERSREGGHALALRDVIRRMSRIGIRGGSDNGWQRLVVEVSREMRVTPHARRGPNDFGSVYSRIARPAAYNYARYHRAVQTSNRDAVPLQAEDVWFSGCSCGQFQMLPYNAWPVVLVGPEL